VRDVIIRADNEDEARLGIQTLIDNGLYHPLWAMAGQTASINMYSVSIEEIVG
jgi:hypothetical protein